LEATAHMDTPEVKRAHKVLAWRAEELRQRAERLRQGKIKGNPKPLAEKLRRAKPEKLAAVRAQAQATLDAVAAEVTRRKEEAAAL